MILLSANNAQTTLANGISASTLTIIVAAGAGALFPSPTTGQFFTLTLNDALTQDNFEICYCTARTGDSLTVMRGQEGTSAQPWLIGDAAYNTLTAGNTNFGGRLISYQVFTAVGTHSYVVPAGANSLEIEVCGSGGGGGASLTTTDGGAGGGAGGYARGTYPATPGATFAVVVPQGGTAGGATSGVDSGGNGGPASFGGSMISATGGQGGLGGTGTFNGGGVGGLGSNGTIVNSLGGPGGDGLAGPGFPYPGNGGASFFGGGGKASTTGFNSLQNGQAIGSGGGGSYRAVGGGGIGANGIVIIKAVS